MPSSKLRASSRNTRPSLERLEDRCTPATWDGGGDGIAWMNAPNWDQDVLPANYDSVTMGYSSLTRVLAAGSGGGGGGLGGVGVSVPGGPPGPPAPLPSLVLVLDQFYLSGNLDIGPNVSLTIVRGGLIDGVITISAGSQVTVSGGTLELADNAGIQGDGVLYVSGSGVLEANDLSAVAKLVLQSGGTLSGTGILQINNAMTWTGGKMIGTGTTLIGTGAMLTIPDSYNTLYLEEGRTLRNEGFVDWQGGNTIATTTGDARYENAFGATWDMGGNGKLLAQAACDVVFASEGLLTKTGTQGMMQEASVFDGVFLASSGEVEVEEGFVQLDGGGEIANSLILANAGTRIELSEGAFSLLPGLVVAGTGFLAVGANVPGVHPLTFVNGNVTATNLELTSGVLTGPGTITVTSQMAWSGGSMEGTGVTRCEGGLQISNMVTTTHRRLESHGEALLQSMSELRVAAAVFENHGILNLEGASRIEGWLIQSVFRNFGTVNKIDAGNAELRLTFANAGLVNVQQGKLSLFGAGNYTGSFSVHAIASLDFTKVEFTPTIHAFAAGSSFSGSGFVSFLGFQGTYTIANGHTLWIAKLGFSAEGRIEGGTISATQFDWKSGTIKDATVLVNQFSNLRVGEDDVCALDNALLMNSGTVEWHGEGNLALARSAKIINDGAQLKGVFSIANGKALILPRQLTSSFAASGRLWPCYHER